MGHQPKKMESKLKNYKTVFLEILKWKQYPDVISATSNTEVLSRVFNLPHLSILANRKMDISLQSLKSKQCAPKVTHKAFSCLFSSCHVRKEEGERILRMPSARVASQITTAGS